MKKLILIISIVFIGLLTGCQIPVEPDVYDDTDLIEQITDINLQLGELDNYDDEELRNALIDLQTELDNLDIPSEFDDRDLLIADEDLQAQIDALNLALADLQDRFDNLVVTTGLNGQTDYYENNEGLYMAEFIPLAKESDYVDLSKFPDYIWDINGDYISIDDLGKLLVAKYFDGLVANANTGFQFRIDFTLYNSPMSNEEFIARLSMLVIELSYYDYYTIDSSQLYFYLYFNQYTVQLKSRMSLLVTDKYTLDPAIFYLELLDVDIEGISYDEVIVQQFCDDFILNETFTGYVLDYK